MQIELPLNTYIRDYAVERLQSEIGEPSRVLVLGASGWFGRTAMALLKRVDGVEVLALGSHSRAIEIDGREVLVHGFDIRLIEEFAPKHILDCAFLTRDKVAQYGTVPYVQRNLEILRNLLQCLESESVESLVSFSSGAAVNNGVEIRSDPYGVLKGFQETLLALLQARTNVNVVMPRVWAVSGAYVQQPQAYAFSDLLRQVLTGDVNIHADHPVIRGYSLVEDVIAISLILALRGRSMEFDTGGEPIELSELVSRMCEAMTVHRQVTRAPFTMEDTDDYTPSNSSWIEVAESCGYRCATLEEQIALAAIAVN